MQIELEKLNFSFLILTEKIESFVFNEDDDDDDEDDEDEYTLSLFKNATDQASGCSQSCNTTAKTNAKNNKNNTNNLMPAIDADTRIKLETLLANAGSSLSFSVFLLLY
jgi:hypothetical protein